MRIRPPTPTRSARPSSRRRTAGSWSAAATLAVLALAPGMAAEPATTSAPPRSVAAGQADPAQDAVRILPLGASNTHGAETGAYRTALWDLLTADRHRIDFVGSLSDGPQNLPDRDHEGHRGWTIDMAAEEARGWVEQHEPDIALVHIGANDLRSGASAQQATDRMNGLLDALHGARPTMTVIVSTLIPLAEADAAVWRETNAGFADLVARRAAAGERVLLANMANGGPQAGEQIPDGVHPTEEGYGLMAQVWHPVVAEAIAARAPATRLTAGAQAAAPDPCGWHAAAVRLAGSLEGELNPRAQRLRAALDRQGIAADSPPPRGCPRSEPERPPADRDRTGSAPTPAPGRGGGTPAPADPQALAPVEVSQNGRFLQFTDGRPFFWLADTGWEMFHRASREDAQRYLDTRAEQGFTVIQAVALAEKGGLDVPTPAGHTPLVDNDPANPAVRQGPDNDYWDDVDHMIDYANSKGMYVALWAAWGSMVHDGPEVVNASNARAYGEFLGERYGGKDVFFVLGGDRQSNAGNNTPEVWAALAEGIGATDTGNRLITFHPWGEESSTEMFPNSSKVIDFNLIQGSHKKVSFEELTTLIVEDYGKTPTKPVIDSEVFYEEHPFNWDSNEGWKTAVHARGAAYYQVFSGAAGHTYGNGAVHQFWEPGMDAPYEVRDPWYEAINHEGATQMQHLKTLMLARSYFDRVPDQSLITSGTGRATRSESGTWAMIYLPEGGSVGVDTSALAGTSLQVTWFNPRTGESQAGGASTGGSFTAPDNEDWVLLLDAV